MAASPDELTRLLARYEGGDAQAGEALVRALYGDLRQLAARHLAAERADHTLQPTALIHEAWLRLAGGEGREIPNRGHFLALASRVMRSLLVDHARAKKAAKRGGGQERIALEEAMAERSNDRTAGPTLDVLALDEALGRLEQVDAKLARLVELRYFAGSTVAEAAEATGLAQRTVERRLQAGTAWLRRELEAEGPA